ncbi:hypothetical protein B7R54_07160 [Subtercola boreus]|uniref:SHOCT domain-containing protein n=1 Tax=Subtercola boreus TaxID=120213 RepID=A0A3E0VGF0_9MICO|nr:SHOCT domain-containing protein [Subtercola boreus]RFA09026.1 hypothetical protein B7R54_07160 [Subtercola boreus]
MLGNLQGYHVLILLAVVVVVIAIVIIVVLSVRRRSAGHRGALPDDPARRIEQLMRLRDQGLVSEEEFEAKRLEILRQM